MSVLCNGKMLKVFLYIFQRMKVWDEELGVFQFLSNKKISLLASYYSVREVKQHTTSSFIFLLQCALSCFIPYITLICLPLSLYIVLLMYTVINKNCTWCPKESPYVGDYVCPHHAGCAFITGCS